MQAQQLNTNDNSEQPYEMQSQMLTQQDENAQQYDISDREVLNYVKQTNPQVYEKLKQLSPEDQLRAFSMMRGNGTEQQNTETEGDL